MASMDKFESGLSMWREYEVPELEDFLQDNALLDEQAMWRNQYDPNGHETDIFAYSMPRADFDRTGRPSNYPGQPQFVWAFNATGKFYAFPVNELRVAYAEQAAPSTQETVPYTNHGATGSLNQALTAAAASVDGYYIRNMCFVDSTADTSMANCHEGDVLGVYE